MDTFDICQNEMQFRIHYFSLALVIPHPVLSWHLCLWLSAESAALVFQWEQLTAACGAAVSRASSGASPGPAGSWFSCAPPWGPGGLCCHLLALQWPGGDNISEAAFAPWVTAAGTPGFTLPNKASRASKLRDDISHFLFSPHKVINERISAVNSLGWFIIYFYFFFYNTPEHNLKLPLESTRLTVPFFSCLVIQCTVIIQFYCFCLGTLQNECWWNSQLIRDKQSFKKSWTEEELFPTSLTNIN